MAQGPDPDTHCIGVDARSDLATGNVEVTELDLSPERQHHLAVLGRPAFTATAFPTRPTGAAASLQRELRATRITCFRSMARSTRHALLHLGSRWPCAGPPWSSPRIRASQSIVDEGFTWIPATRQEPARPTTDTDETTDYYWEGLSPSDFYGGTAPMYDALLGAELEFKKQSGPPTRRTRRPSRSSPTSRSPLVPTEGVRRYHLQVSSERASATSWTT